MQTSFNGQLEHNYQDYAASIANFQLQLQFFSSSPTTHSQMIIFHQLLFQQNLLPIIEFSIFFNYSTLEPL